VRAAPCSLRRRWQGVVMQAEISREVERLTGRKVIGFMSDNHTCGLEAIYTGQCHRRADARAVVAFRSGLEGSETGR
jgi:hypothetical protein